MFGELSTFEHGVRSASITADTDMVLLRLDRQPLLDIMSSVPGAGLAIARGLCILPPGHPLEARASVPLARLQDEPLIALPPGTVWRTRVESAFDEAANLPFADEEQHQATVEKENKS